MCLSCLKEVSQVLKGKALYFQTFSQAVRWPNKGQM